ncbi:MAG: hypothetical protein HKL90_04105 [Elusimicrobia bacterium]|nr:hypothetical protein [Elusimicrobiota bacterium]
MRFRNLLIAVAIVVLQAARSRAGLVLEDTAVGIGPIGKVQYDPKFNAITLDGRNVYFAPVSSRDLVVLCRALAKDNRVGVSLGAAEIVYGAVPKNSEVALVLKLADMFLADIVFARRDATSGYVYANRYEPQLENDASNVAAFFKIHRVQFVIKKQEIVLAGVGFTDTIIPLKKQKTADGGNLPDEDAIRAGRKFPQFEANAVNVADGIDYYKNELVLRQAFGYGEVAGFLRALRDGGVDLDELARSVEASAAKSRNFIIDSTRGVVMPPLKLSSEQRRSNYKNARTLKTYWVQYLRDIQHRRDYRNWSGPPYDLYRRQHQ